MDTKRATNGVVLEMGSGKEGVVSVLVVVEMGNGKVHAWVVEERNRSILLRFHMAK